MKIVFWGTPKFAAENLLSIIDSGYEVLAVVTQPDRKRGRGKTLSPSPVKQIAIDHDIPVHTTYSISKDEKTKELIFNLKADLYLVDAFGQILPKEILDHPKFGCWNSHASLLPKWRGAAPIQWSIINEDANTGVCIMAMETGLDTGPVIMKESTEISDTDNLETLTNRLSKISSKLIIKFLEKIIQIKGLNETQRLKKLNPINQKLLKATPSYARQITKEDYLIDWNQEAKKIIKKIQGLYPNAFTFYNGKRIKIIEASLLMNNIISIEIESKAKYPGVKRLPGEIVSINKQYGIEIMTANYPILVKYAQLEGKSKTDGFTLSCQANLNIKDIVGTKMY